MLLKQNCNSFLCLYISYFIATVPLTVALITMKQYCVAVCCSSFTGNVKLKGVVVIGGEDEQHPKELRL